MGRPIALCLERLARDDEERYVRCTARSGREAGLAIAADGSILWVDARPPICELWVSRDQRLMAVRPNGAPAIHLARGERRLEMPEGRAVVVLDQDTLEFGSHRFCVHVHGPTDEVHPPRPLRVRRDMAVAAALALSVGCGGEMESGFVANQGGATQKADSSQVGTGGSLVGSGGALQQLAVGTGGIGIVTTIPLGIGGAGSSVPQAGTAGQIEIVDFPPL